MNKPIEELIQRLKEPDYKYYGCELSGEEAELAISALEKQILKKPEYYGDSEDGKLLCPSCGEDLWDIRECGFIGCPYCLQTIDWRNEDE